MQGRCNLMMVFISTNELLLTSKASKGCFPEHNQTQTGTYRIPWPTSACATSPARHWAGEQMNRKTSTGGGSGGGQGIKDKAVFLVQVTPPYSLFLAWQQLHVAAMLFHHLSPGCKSQVQHGSGTHLSQEWPYGVWIGSLSKSVHIYMKLTYICFTEWQGIHIIYWKMNLHAELAYVPIMEINPSE